MTTTPWNDWEDWHAGLYNRHPIDTARVQASRDLLSDPDQFIEVALEVVRSWPHAALQGIVRLPEGAHSWVGQASCCYAHRATGMETREAWGQLTDAQRRAANAVADVAIDRFRREVIDGAQTLFDR